MDQKKILVDYLLMKVSLEDWRAVEDAARDLRAIPASSPKNLAGFSGENSKSSVPPLAAIPPVTMDIPHHQSEVVSMLRMSPNDLAERLFPDFTQEGIADANE